MRRQIITVLTIVIALALVGGAAFFYLGPEIRATMAATRGLDEQQAGRQNRAIEAFDETIRLKPNDASAFYYRGSAYAREHEHDRAIADYDRAIAIEPDYADAIYARAVSWELKSEHDRAIADYDRAIGLRPRPPAEWFLGRSIAYLLKGEARQAIEDDDRAREIDARCAFCFLIRAFADESAGEHDRAGEDRKRAMAIYPCTCEAYHLIEANEDKRGQDRSIALFDLAIRVKPDESDAYYARGLAYARKGDHDRAIQDFNQALALEPNDADVLLARSHAYSSRGDDQRAKADEDAAKKLKRSNPTPTSGS
ncbi:MAG TPA: tetratricopeptide repeat protein [Stellaceae bacterium]|nr:tetratricopeptide repeat protein [Stellaceae bacterium]